MPQFLVSSGQQPGNLVVLSPEESRHLVKVLRKQEGDTVLLTDGHGHRFSGRIRSTALRAATILIEEALPEKTLHGQLTLAQALLKGDKMEFVIQKAAELGVHAVIPFASSRSISKIDPRTTKISRWKKIAQAASKQCGRAAHMVVEESVLFETLVEKEAEGTKIIFWEEANRSLRDFFCGAPSDSMESVAALIGPEGGFSRTEVDFAVGHGFAPVSLGSLILRAETAAVAAITLIQYELGNI